MWLVCTDSLEFIAHLKQLVANYNGYHHTFPKASQRCVWHKKEILSEWLCEYLGKPCESFPQGMHFHPQKVIILTTGIFSDDKTIWAISTEGSKSPWSHTLLALHKYQCLDRRMIGDGDNWLYESTQASKRAACGHVYAKTSREETTWCD